MADSNGPGNWFLQRWVTNNTNESDVTQFIVGILSKYLILFVVIKAWNISDRITTSLRKYFLEEHLS